MGNRVYVFGLAWLEFNLDARCGTPVFPEIRT